ncbi:hypothetical protein GPJ56_010721 [Histomonas meleagridis]|uniref:uncharacterized protein n=1 Tax=Histomonas meleagridis TaxID=135588 RepID=UPI0035596A55|nr:hypothetical protein GPJ56_010721 [Histomonas meleagridis]KAH0801054.1 hypothetical protein GO595_006089 [Histomonas meleagridis]
MAFNFDNDDFGFGWSAFNVPSELPSPTLGHQDTLSFENDNSSILFPNTLEFDKVNNSPKKSNSRPQQSKAGSRRHQRAPSTPINFPPNVNLLELLRQVQLGNVFKNQKGSRQKTLPIPQINNVNSADHEFNSICSDQGVKFNPHRLGFIPHSYWQDKEMTFGELVREFFQRKNNANSRFYHKLYNALKIVEDDPFYIDFIGIEWVNEKVLKVDKFVFARLLGIKTIDGSLFHQQGNFPSHGFVELGSQEASEYVDKSELNGVDFDKVRLLVHQSGIFIKGCDEDTIENCKWKSSRKRSA